MSSGCVCSRGQSHLPDPWSARFDPTKLLQVGLGSMRVGTHDLFEIFLSQHYVQYGKDEGRDPHCAGPHAMCHILHPLTIPLVSEGGLPAEDTSGTSERPQASAISEQPGEPINFMILSPSNSPTYVQRQKKVSLPRKQHNRHVGC